MPLYDFYCKKCGKKHEVCASIEARDKVEITCFDCKGKCKRKDFYGVPVKIMEKGTNC